MAISLVVNAAPQAVRSIEDALAVFVVALLLCVLWLVIFRVRYGPTWLAYIRRSLRNRWLAVSVAMGLVVVILPFVLLGERVNAATLIFALGGLGFIVGLMWAFILWLLYPPHRDGAPVNQRLGSERRG